MVKHLIYFQLSCFKKITPFIPARFNQKQKNQDILPKYPANALQYTAAVFFIKPFGKFFCENAERACVRTPQLFSAPDARCVRMDHLNSRM
jgi:hypothetical protein